MPRGLKRSAAHLVGLILLAGVAGVAGVAGEPAPMGSGQEVAGAAGEGRAPAPSSEERIAKLEKELADLRKSLDVRKEEAASKDSSPGQAWEIAAEVSAFDKYVSRGCNLFDDPVMQGQVSVGYKGFKFAVWGNQELKGRSGVPSSEEHDGEITEVDYSAEYAFGDDLFDAAAGAICYRFPNTGSDPTEEVFGRLGLKVPLSPALTVYRDVDETDGLYAAFSVKHTFEDLLKPAENVGISLDLGAAVGYGCARNNAACFGRDDDALNDLTLTAKMPFKIGARWTLAPSIGYSTLLDKGVRKEADRDDNVWTGVTLSFVF